MMKKSLRSKLILNFVMSVVLVMLTLIAATNFVFRPILIHDTRDSMMSYAALISEAYDNGSATINKLIAMLDSSHDYETVIYRDDISVIASYEQMYPTSGRIAMIKEWMKEYEEHKKSDGTFFKEIEKNSDNLSRAVYIKELSDGTYLCMSKVVRGVDQIVYIATIGVTVGAIFLIIIGTAIWSVLTKSFTSQLKKMSIVTQKMSQLNFDEKIDYHSEDEVGVLAESIDEMSDELKVSIEKLKGWFCAALSSLSLAILNML